MGILKRNLVFIVLACSSVFIFFQAHSFQASVTGRDFVVASEKLKSSLQEQGGFQNVEILTDFEIEEIEECHFKSDHLVVFDLTMEYRNYLNSFHFRNFKDVFEYRYFYVCREVKALEGDFKKGYSVRHSFIAADNALRVQIYYEFNRK